MNDLVELSAGGVAPDCRLSKITTPKGAIQGSMGWMEPVFCANCGVRGPDVPAENMTFAFWLCDKQINGCFERFGAIAGTMVMPDQVFWQKIKEESLEHYGRELTHEELGAVVASDTSPLATLIKEGR